MIKIHTITIKYKINVDEYENFKNSSQTNAYQVSDRWILKNSYLISNGLTLYADKYTINGCTSYYYKMYVNPSEVLGNESVIALYEFNQFQEFQEKFNDLVQQYDIYVPSLKYWIAFEVDYTQDIHTENVDLYVKLLQKSDLTGYKFAKGTRYRSGSLYAKCKSYVLNFYNKADELRNKGYSDEEIQQAENVLRIEVQCRKLKLNTLKYKYKLESKGIEFFLQRSDIAEETLQYYCKSLFLTQPYIKKTAAINKIINADHLQNRTKKAMIDIINDVARQYSSIDKVKQNNNMYAEQFKALGINIVTIDKNVKGVKRLESISDMIA